MHRADELGSDSGADAAQLVGRRLCRALPLRESRVPLRTTGVRVVPRDTERAAHGLRSGGQATDIRTGAGGVLGRTGLTAAKSVLRPRQCRLPSGRHLTGVVRAPNIRSRVVTRISIQFTR